MSEEKKSLIETVGKMVAIIEAAKKLGTSGEVKPEEGKEKEV